MQKIIKIVNALTYSFQVAYVSINEIFHLIRENALHYLFSSFQHMQIICVKT